MDTIDKIKLLKQNAPYIYNTYRIKKITELQRKLQDLREEYKNGGKELADSDRTYLIEQATKIKSFITELNDTGGGRNPALDESQGS